MSIPRWKSYEKHSDETAANVLDFILSHAAQRRKFKQKRPIFVAISAIQVWRYISFFYSASGQEERMVVNCNSL
jgi:hypothetical protein